MPPLKVALVPMSSSAGITDTSGSGSLPAEMIGN